MGNKLSNNIIKTRKSKNEVLEIIRAKTDNRKIETMFSLESGLQTQSTDKYFYGKVEGDSFELCRIIKHRNSFCPILFGKVEENGNETSININTRLDKNVKIFVTIWFAIVVIMCIAFPFFNFKAYTDIPFFVNYIPYYMLVCGGIALLIIYNIEKNMAIKKFKESLQG